jgi:hypothetical protein
MKETVMKVDINYVPPVPPPPRVESIVLTLSPAEASVLVSVLGTFQVGQATSPMYQVLDAEGILPTHSVVYPDNSYEGLILKKGRE